MDQSRRARPTEQDEPGVASGERQRAVSFQGSRTSARPVQDLSTIDPANTPQHFKHVRSMRGTTDLLLRESVSVEDVRMAGQSPAALLISASTRAEVEALSRRIHQASDRATAPFVKISAGTLPTDPESVMESCWGLVHAAAGGSVLMTDIEEMPAAVQDILIDLLDEHQRTRAQSAAIRLISGTTGSLLEHVVAGTFSDRLFYRLNVFHFIV